MKFIRSSTLALPVLSVLLALSGCGGNSQSQTPAAPSFTTDNLASQGQWIYGDWQLQGSPSSLGDLGADVRSIKITPGRISYQIFGHLAAESMSFNTDGYDYGGNCLFQVSSTTFGLGNDGSGALGLYVENPRYELIDDPGNRNDCAKQIERINRVADQQRLVFSGFERIDDETFEGTRAGAFPGQRIYKRAKTQRMEYSR